MQQTQCPGERQGCRFVISLLGVALIEIPALGGAASTLGSLPLCSMFAN